MTGVRLLFPRARVALEQVKRLKYPQWWWVLLLALILVLALIIRGYGLAYPWLGGHRANNGLFWSGLANSYLKYGYLATRFAPVFDNGLLAPTDFAYYLRHPPLLPLFVSLAFRLLGVHDWSAGLVPLAFSAGNLALVYFLGNRIGGKFTGLLAAFFMAVVPMDAYFGRQVNVEGPTMFFWMLTLFAYLTWLKDPRPRFFWTMIAAFVAGALMDWPGYYIAPLIPVHYLIWGYLRGKDKKMLVALPVVAAGVFGAYLLYVWWLTGSLATLQGAYADRSSFGGGGLIFTSKELYDFIYGTVRDDFTPVPRLLAVVWVAFALSDAFRRRDTSRHAIVLLLFAMGFLHIALFPQGAWVHEFWSHHLTPFFVIAGALGGVLICQRLFASRVLVSAVFILLLSWLFVTQSAARTSDLIRFSRGERNPMEVAFWRNQIPALLNSGDRFITSAPLDHRATTVFSIPSAYLDRDYRVAKTVEDFKALLDRGPAYKLYIGAGALDKGLGEYLVQRFPLTTFDRFSIFDLTAGTPSVTKEVPPLQRVVNVDFGDKIRFVGFTIQRKAPLIRGQDDRSLLAKYFESSRYYSDMPHPEEMARITLVWQSLAGIETDYPLRVRLNAFYGQAYSLALDHKPLNGIYGTGMWRKGDVIREEYDVLLPPEYPPVGYDLLVGIGDDKACLRPTLAQGLPCAQALAPAGKAMLVEPPKQDVVTAIPGDAEGGKRTVTDDLAYAGRTVTWPSSDEVGVTTYWESISSPAKDYNLKVVMANGTDVITRTIPAVTSLWERGKYYRAEAHLPVSPLKLPGRYTLSIQVSDGADAISRFDIGAVEIGKDLPLGLIAMTGNADSSYADLDGLDARHPMRVEFALSRSEDVQLEVAWTGEAQNETTTVNVYVRREDWHWPHNKFIGQWEVSRGKYTVTRMTIPRLLLREGDNLVLLEIPDSIYLPLNWQWPARLLPEFAGIVAQRRNQCPSGDCNLAKEGWTRPDAAAVKVLRKNLVQDDYIALARIFRDRRMPVLTGLLGIGTPLSLTPTAMPSPSPTPVPTLPPNTWEYHGAQLMGQTGQLDGNLRWAQKGKDKPGALVNGPYAPLPVGDYLARFVLKVGDDTSPEPAAKIDVSAEAASPPYYGAAREIKGLDFRSAGTFQEFELPFTIDRADLPLEYRVWFTGVADLWFEKVTIRQVSPVPSPSPTPVPTLPPNTWEYHGAQLMGQTGQLDGNLRWAQKGKDKPGALVNGPYAPLPVGDYLARFVLKVGDDTSPEPAAKIDVSAEAASPPYYGAAREIKGLDFRSAGAFQEFELPFTIDQADLSLEYRVWFTGVADLWFEKVTIRQLSSR